MDSAQIEFGLYFSNDFRKGSSPTVVALRPGWNRVEFDIPLEKLQFHYSLEDARGMTIGFSQGGQGIPPVVYLDNVGFATRTTQLKPIQITLKNTDAVKEIADFEDPIQEHAFMYSNGESDPLLQSSRQVNSASRRHRGLNAENRHLSEKIRGDDMDANQFGGRFA